MTYVQTTDRLQPLRALLYAVMVAADRAAGTDPFTPWVRVAAHVDLAVAHLYPAGVAHGEDLDIADATSTHQLSDASGITAALQRALDELTTTAAADNATDNADVDRDGLRSAQLLLRKALDSAGGALNATRDKQTLHP